MARTNEIQYVRFYTAGSAAQQVEFPQRNVHTEPSPKPKAKKPAAAVVKLDGLAVVGTIVAVILLVCMLIGFFQVCQANAEADRMRAYVAQLEVENQELRTQYEHGYDLEEIRLAAESMGMIPLEQAQRITISIPEPVVEVEPTWWEQLLEDFKTLFA